MLIAIALLLFAYLVGSIPFGYVLVGLTKHVDVRDYGSKSVGAINVFRVGGPVLGLATIFLDGAKGFLPVLLTAYLVPGIRWAVPASGFLTVVGHAYSVWMWLKERRFSEGKSIASGFFVIVAFTVLGKVPWPVPVASLAIWILYLLAPKVMTGKWWSVSPATIATTVATPFLFWLARTPIEYTAYAVAMSTLIIIRHRNNFLRLIGGDESQIGQKTKVEPQAEKPAEP
jgi:acyl phosphate:glycerol-3-phosphate acyltransferase